MVTQEEIRLVYETMKKIASVSSIPTTLVAEISKLPLWKVRRILRELEVLGLVEKVYVGRGYLWRIKKLR